MGLSEYLVVEKYTKLYSFGFGKLICVGLGHELGCSKDTGNWIVQF